MAIGWLLYTNKTKHNVFNLQDKTQVPCTDLQKTKHTTDPALHTVAPFARSQKVRTYCIIIIIVVVIIVINQ